MDNGHSFDCMVLAVDAISVVMVDAATVCDEEKGREKEGIPQDALAEAQSQKPRRSTQNIEPNTINIRSTLEKKFEDQKGEDMQCLWLGVCREQS